MGTDAAEPVSSRASHRRNLLKIGLWASMIAPLAKAVAAISPAGGEGGMTSTGKTTVPGRSSGQLDNPAALLDAFAISQLLVRERSARELHDYDAEAACFDPEATVEVSWFKGTAAEFIAAGRKTSAAGDNADSAYFDSLSPASISVHGNRALADSACAIHTFLPLDGVQASMTSFTRLLCRIRRSNGEWRIAGLRAVYIRDQLEPCNPAEIPTIDLKKLNGFRPSYRHLSYALEANGRPMRDDLPGVDRPAGVAALRAAERQWLAA